jgi:DNA-directed RNA polymerase specialized sigma24 family protein
MAAAADGDRDALDPLFHALWPVVSRYTTRLVGGDEALGEDAAQDALAALFAQLDRYDRERDALTWALAHATWAARTVRRRVQRRAETCELPDAAVDPTHVERDLVRAALATLATLSPRDIEVIAAALTDDDGLRAAIRPATFRKRLERALDRLRASWRSRHDSV